jgi:hypothetical protein
MDTDNCQQTCINTAGSFACSCLAGFTSSGATCTDINECTVNNGGCDTICMNTEGSFQCSCDGGFEFDTNGNCVGTYTFNYIIAYYYDNCCFTDINECESSSNNCQQICTNTEGSFMCSCQAGFTSSTSGATCTDINECAISNGGCEQNCTNSEGSFECSCSLGFTLGVDGRTCNNG